MRGEVPLERKPTLAFRAQALLLGLVPGLAHILLLDRTGWGAVFFVLFVLGADGALAGLFLLKLSSIDYQADALAGYERNGQSAERERASYLERLNALTPEDIRRAAQKYLDPARMVAVVVGDEATLRPAIKGPIQ